MRSYRKGRPKANSSKTDCQERDIRRLSKSDQGWRQSPKVPASAKAWNPPLAPKEEGEGKDEEEVVRRRGKKGMDERRKRRWERRKQQEEGEGGRRKGRGRDWRG